MIVVLFLAPQTGLQADDGDSGRKNNSLRVDESKSPGFEATPFATKEALDALSQAINEIKLKIDTLEQQVGDLPEDLEGKLAALDETASNNSSDISLAFSDIEGITDRLEKLKMIVDDITARLELLESAVDDHELRLLVLENSEPPKTDVVFSGDFINGQAADIDTQQAWIDFRGNASGAFVSIEITNSVGSAICSDPVVATDIANELNTHVPSPPLIVSFECDGRWWNIGGNNDTSVELNAGADLNVSQCTQFAAVRPQIGNLNWGGVGETCNAPSQTLQVILTR